MSGATPPDFESILKTQVMEERKFLHDIASPVGTLMFVAEAVGDLLKEKGAIGPDEEEQLKVLQSQLERMRDMIVERRKTLHERSAVVGLPPAGAAGGGSGSHG
jgi:hypothetical protein